MLSHLFGLISKNDVVLQKHLSLFFFCILISHCVYSKPLFPPHSAHFYMKMGSLWLLSEIPVRCVLSSCLDDPSNIPNPLVEVFCSSFASAHFTLISVQHLFLLLVLLLQPEPVTHKLPPTSYAWLLPEKIRWLTCWSSVLNEMVSKNTFLLPGIETLLKACWKQRICFHLLFATWSSKVPKREPAMIFTPKDRDLCPD